MAWLWYAPKSRTSHGIAALSIVASPALEPLLLSASSIPSAIAFTSVMHHILSRCCFSFSVWIVLLQSLLYFSIVTFYDGDEKIKGRIEFYDYNIIQDGFSDWFLECKNFCQFSPWASLYSLQICLSFSIFVLRCMLMISSRLRSFTHTEHTFIGSNCFQQLLFRIGKKMIEKAFVVDKQSIGKFHKGLECFKSVEKLSTLITIHITSWPILCRIARKL